MKGAYVLNLGLVPYGGRSVLLGPGDPGHNNHFHFDVSTFRLVQIFEDGQLLAPLPRPAAPSP